MESIHRLITTNNYSNIDSSQLIELLNHNNVLILDVRSHKEFKAGHIENAQNYPVDTLLSKITQIKSYKHNEVIVYCASGVRSLQASQILCENGFEKVYNLTDGMSSYKGNLIKK